MTEPMREALSTLHEHLPNVDLDAVRDHLPSLKDVDASAITERVKSKTRGKWSITAMIVGLLAGGAAVAAYLRRHREPAYSADMYTPPLPKP